MTDTAILTSSEIGMLRIYMAPRDTAERKRPVFSTLLTR